MLGRQTCRTSNNGMAPVAQGWFITTNKSENMRHPPNVVFMLAQRRRRLTNIKTTLGRCLLGKAFLCRRIYMHVAIPFYRRFDGVLLEAVADGLF